MTNCPSEQLRILLVEDHLVVRAGLRLLIESQPGMQVVALAANREEALKFAACEAPDLILLDLKLGEESGLAFLPELRAVTPKARVLVLTSSKDVDVHRQAVRLGAAGIVLKDQEPEVLIKAIRKVHAGEVWLDRTTTGNLFHEMTQNSGELDPEQSKIQSLTDREFQVIKLIAEGLKNKEIGKRLFISETTVTHHLSSIFSKLEVSDRLELVIYAFAQKLATMPRPSNAS
jgi:DNA-binding NarL/FixJ family response regulator